MIVLVAFATIVLIAVPFPVDPMNYFQAAQDPWLSEPDHWTTRIGLVLPVWLVSLIFGYSEVAFYAVPVIAAAGLAAATVWTGRLLFNRWVGIGSAVLVVVGPFVLPYASQVLPDISSAAMITLAFGWAARVAMKAEDSQRGAWVAGIFIGYAYLIRETSLLFVPGLIVFALILGLRGRQLLSIAAGSLAIAAAEALIAISLWGDPLARIHALQQRAFNPSPTPRQVGLTEVAMERQSDIGSSASIFVDLLWSTVHGRVVLALSVILLVGAVVYRSRRLLAILAWVVIPWLLFAILGSLRPDPDAVFIRLELGRYWAAQLPPMVLGGLGALSLFASDRRSRLGSLSPRAVAAVLVLVGGVAGLAVSVGSYSDFYVRLGNDQYWQLRQSLASLPPGTTLDASERYRALYGLYANDPIGRPVFDGEIQRDGSDPGDGVIVELGRSASHTGLESSATADWFQVRLGGVDDEFHWAILTNPTIEESLFELGPAWQARHVVNGEWGAQEDLTPDLLDLEDEESVVVFDHTAGYREPNPEQTQPVLPGEVVLGVYQTDVEGGQVRVACIFFPLEAPTERIQVGGSVSTVVLRDARALVSLCEAPNGGSGYLVRPVMTIEGPVQASLGSGVVSSGPGASSAAERLPAPGTRATQKRRRRKAGIWCSRKYFGGS